MAAGAAYLPTNLFPQVNCEFWLSTDADWLRLLMAGMWPECGPDITRNKQIQVQNKQLQGRS